ncbi:response regulator transcription factor [Paraburkholderia hayleyella]|uniref:response regulator transcription factor n=1 Tax=Paraburkholderia hayleyella TaxID=2152889 RepID=UPI001FE4F8F4|nr:response regulator transcription factor [Paraburkholderia hayleyella]
MNLRVILADDHPFVLLGVRANIELQQDVKVVGEATNATSLIHLLKSTECDVLVTDLSMPDTQGQVEDGLSLVKKIKSEWPSIHIVVLTGITNIFVIRSLLVDGVAGLVSKTETMDSISAAIRCVSEGGTYVSRSTIASILMPLKSMEGDSASFSCLSEIQMKIVGMFAQGRTLDEMVTYFGRDIRSIRRYKRDAMLKLGVKSDPGLFALMRSRGFA